MPRVGGKTPGVSIGGVLLWAAVLSLGSSPIRAETFDVLHGFESPPATSRARVIEGAGGFLYGTTQGGGTYGWGVVFKVKKDGTGFLTLHDFSGLDGQSPLAGLVEGTDGSFYGTAFGGGAYGSGVLFRLSADGTRFLKLHDFRYDNVRDGVSPVGDLLQGSDGAIYGTTQNGGFYGSGVVFKINRNGSNFTDLHDFEWGNPADGASPLAGLVEGPDGALYGTAFQGGAHNAGIVFKINKDGSGFLNLHDFMATNGFGPYGTLLLGTDDALYGTTERGGVHGSGVIVKINRSGGGFRKLHDFNYDDGSDPTAGLVEGLDSALYGTTQLGGALGAGTAFKIERDGTGFLTLHNVNVFDEADGAFPKAGVLAASDGALYGTTPNGGSDGPGGPGVLYRVATNGSGFVKVHQFSYGDAARPYAAVVEGTDGALYATTRDGGRYGYGTLFKLNKDGTGFSKLHDFSNEDGAFPQGSLVEGSDGALYGTTFAGGVGGYGTAFRIEKDGTGLLTLHGFKADSGGSQPSSALVEGSDGALYGTTRYSGAYLAGVVFKINKDATDFMTLHDFTNDDGARPYAGLVEGSDGALYGTTRDWGANRFGTVFRINEDGTGFVTLHDFSNQPTDGANPEASLLEGLDGALYGTTVAGGLFASGLVFKINKDGSGFVDLHDFNADDIADGGSPQAGLVEGSDDALYGTTSAGGAYDYGIAFKINKDGTGFSNLHDFNYGATVSAASPHAGLIESSDGAFYGMTLYGGPRAGGVIFRLTTNPAMPSISKSDVAVTERGSGTKPQRR